MGMAFYSANIWLYKLSKQISFKGVIHEPSLAYRAKLSSERFLAFARNDNTFDLEPI